MANINNFPTTGLVAGTTTHVVGTETYVWNGSAWDLQVTTGGGGGGGTTVVANPDTTTGILESITIGSISYAINTGGVDVVTSLPTAGANTVGTIVYLNQIDTSTSPDRELGFYIGTTTGGVSPSFGWALVGNTTTVSDGTDQNTFEDIDEIIFDPTRFSLARPSTGDRDHIEVDIATGGVGVNELADNAVTNAKMADDAVNTNELVDDAVTGPKIANNSVGEGHLLFSNGTTELPGRVITYGTGGFSTIASPVPAIAQNTGNIVDNQNRLNALTTRLGDLEDEVHNIEASSSRATTNFFRTITTIDSPPSDTLVDYTNAGGTTRNWTLSSTTAGTATFVQGSVALDSDIDQHTTSHISDIYGHELTGGTYRRTQTGGVTSGQITYGGDFITPVASMELVVGGQTLRIPLRISHDGQGRIYTHLYFPWPVDVDLAYTSYTITYHYVDIGAAGSNINLTPDAGEDVLRVGLVEAARTALTTGTPTIFVRYNEPSTNRVVEHLVSSVSTPTGTSQVNGQYGFQFVDLTLSGRSITGPVQPPTNTDVTVLINGATHPDTSHGTLTLRSPNGNHTVTLSVDVTSGQLVSSVAVRAPDFTET